MRHCTRVNITPLSRSGALACDMGIFEICLLKYFLQFYPQRLTFGTAGSHPGGTTSSKYWSSLAPVVSELRYDAMNLPLVCMRKFEIAIFFKDR